MGKVEPKKLMKGSTAMGLKRTSVVDRGKELCLMRRAGYGPYFMWVIVDGDALDVRELFVDLDVMNLQGRVRGV